MPKPPKPMPKKSKPIRSFIREHRDELTAVIRRRLQRPEFKLNDDKRHQWILNDYELYRWALAEGVNV